MVQPTSPQQSVPAIISTFSCETPHTMRLDLDNAMFHLACDGPRMARLLVSTAKLPFLWVAARGKPAIGSFLPIDTTRTTKVT